MNGCAESGRASTMKTDSGTQNTVEDNCKCSRQHAIKLTSYNEAMLSTFIAANRVIV